jgi:riboflavin kinase/FMN adenylyltransferase
MFFLALQAHSIRWMLEKERIERFSDGTIMTIGNFDGVHLGHQHMLNLMVSEAKKHNIPSIVMVFEPHPIAFFTAGDQKNVTRLMSLRSKCLALKDLGVDFVCVIPFNAIFSSVTADMFIERYLVHVCQVTILFVGEDFHFGYRRAGDIKMLKEASVTKGFKLVVSNDFLMADNRVSSTRIREALSQHLLEAANQLLGKPLTVIGRVAKGAGIGHKLLVPTANVLLYQSHLPLRGVYAVIVTYHDKRYHGVANIGYRPSVCGEKYVLEVYIFSFNKTLYGEIIAVSFLKKIRDEAKFADLSALKVQIMKDVDSAKIYFNQLKNTTAN